MFEIGAIVRIIGGGPEVWTVVGSRGIEPLWEIQLVADENSVEWKRTFELELVAESKQPDMQPPVSSHPPKLNPPHKPME